jgi:hypothetical protein
MFHFITSVIKPIKKVENFGNIYKDNVQDMIIEEINFHSFLDFVDLDF